MSKYTTEVRFICETAAGMTESYGYHDLDVFLDAGSRAIFDFDYPIFDTAYRPVLQTKILKHYYTREISEETVGLWKLRLNARMNEIMPFYNKLYESELLAFNPLYDVDYTRAGNRSGSQDKQETSTTDSNTSQTATSEGSVDSVRGSSREEIRSGTQESQKDTLQSENDSARTNQTNTGTETRSLSTETTESGTRHKTSRDSGQDSTSKEFGDTRDHWDFYSDTPQGTIGFIPGSSGEPQAVGALEDQTYLTNVRHTTDSTETDIDESTTTYGKVNTEDSTESKSTESTGTDTLTLNTDQTNTSASNRETTGNETNATTEHETKSGNESGTETERHSGETKSSVTGNVTGSSEGNVKSLEDYTERVSGKMGGASYSKMLKEFRETFLNIDMMIIRDLSDLFFGLWE